MEPWPGLNQRRQSEPSRVVDVETANVPASPGAPSSGSEVMAPASIALFVAFSALGTICGILPPIVMRALCVDQLPTLWGELFGLSIWAFGGCLLLPLILLSGTLLMPKLPNAVTGSSASRPSDASNGTIDEPAVSSCRPSDVDVQLSTSNARSEISGTCCSHGSHGSHGSYGSHGGHGGNSSHGSHSGRHYQHPARNAHRRAKLRLVSVSRVRAALQEQRVEDVMRDLYYGVRFLDDANSSTEFALVSYRQLAQGDADGYTMDHEGMRSVFAAAEKAKIGSLWLDAWCFRFSGEYDHTAFCETLSAVVRKTKAVVWMPVSRRGVHPSYQFRLWVRASFRRIPLMARCMMLRGVAPPYADTDCSSCARRVVHV